ncbi:MULTISPECIES: OsmC family protein [Acidianus]|uniref:Peroxiredoxin n=1 Tax=Candidatus Acidianus copahuensis TaxID=1160895 RepID=A0A031LNK2_9CREN|nr:MULTISPECIES: OsmC family protein [Acidianus]EZQ04724.1 peroxiredoxin [Candidatus Acidianus copahuensis]NON63347.1 OsmC family protein [Acidianus sp. RZ1]
MITFTVEGKLQGDIVRACVAGKEIEIGLMGSDYPTPEEVLLSSALSCMILTIYYIAKERNVKVNNIEGYIEGTMDPRGFQGDPEVHPGLLEVNYYITVESEDRRINEILEQSIKRCPLKDTLSRPVKINVNWDIRNGKENKT